MLARFLIMHDVRSNNVSCVRGSLRDVVRVVLTHVCMIYTSEYGAVFHTHTNQPIEKRNIGAVRCDATAPMRLMLLPLSCQFGEDARAVALDSRNQPPLGLQGVHHRSHVIRLKLFAGWKMTHDAGFEIDLQLGSLLRQLVEARIMNDEEWESLIYEVALVDKCVAACDDRLDADALERPDAPFHVNCRFPKLLPRR